MWRTYGAVFRVRGAAAFCGAGFLMRLSIALYPIALVLVISAREGRYGFASVLSAVYVLGGVPGQPVLGRLVDRLGQRALLVPASVVHAASVAGLAALLQSHAPHWALLGPTFLAGFSYLSVGSLVRARWSLVLAGRPELSTAYSLESTLDELIFVIGPLLATLVATSTDPVLVLVFAPALVLGGAVWLARLRDTEPPRRPVGAAAHRSALREPGMALLVATAGALGVIFASAEICMIAFAGQHGHRGLAGVVVALFAGGSGVAGFVYGTRVWQLSLLDRFRRHAVVFGLLCPLFLLVPNVWVLLAVSFGVGTTIAPTLITAFGLVERIVPGHALTEGLSWLLTGLNVGYGVGAAVVGGLADAHGARTAFAVTSVAGLATAGVATLLHRRLRGGAVPPADGTGAAPGAAPPPADPPVAPSQHAALP